MAKESVKYPEVEVDLSSVDGNAFSIMGAVSKALKKAGHKEEECKKFRDEAMEGDYNDLLQTCTKWVTVV